MLLQKNIDQDQSAQTGLKFFAVGKFFARQSTSLLHDPGSC